MEEMSVVLPVLLYVLGIVLLVVLIILGIKLIKVVDKTDRILDDVEGKVKSLDGFFSIFDKVSDSILSLSGTVVSSVSGLISRVFKRGKRKEEIDYE